MLEACAVITAIIIIYLISRAYKKKEPMIVEKTTKAPDLLDNPNPGNKWDNYIGNIHTNDNCKDTAQMTNRRRNVDDDISARNTNQNERAIKGGLNLVGKLRPYYALGLDNPRNHDWWDDDAF